jgi:hypothetical protein
MIFEKDIGVLKIFKIEKTSRKPNKYVYHEPQIHVYICMYMCVHAFVSTVYVFFYVLQVQDMKNVSLYVIIRHVTDNRPYDLCKIMHSKGTYALYV